MVDLVIGAAAGAAATAVLKGRKKGQPRDDPKIRHALLLPAATVIGKELALRLEGMFSKGREKRIENLQAHISRAEAISGPEGLDKVAEEPAFADWAEGVSKVDPKDDDLATIWQAALLALKNGGLDRMRILAVARSMQPDEAAAFLQVLRKQEAKERTRKRILFGSESLSEVDQSPSWQRLLEKLLLRGPVQLRFEAHHTAKFFTYGLLESFWMKSSRAAGWAIFILLFAVIAWVLLVNLVADNRYEAKEITEFLFGIGQTSLFLTLGALVAFVFLIVLSNGRALTKDGLALGRLAGKVLTTNGV